MKYVNELAEDVTEDLKRRMEVGGFDSEDINNALDSKVDDVEDLMEDLKLTEWFNTVK